jgi:hypothetical protein
MLRNLFTSSFVIGINRVTFPLTQGLMLGTRPVAVEVEYQRAGRYRSSSEKAVSPVCIGTDHVLIIGERLSALEHLNPSSFTCGGAK